MGWDVFMVISLSLPNSHGFGVARKVHTLIFMLAQFVLVH